MRRSPPQGARPPYSSHRVIVRRLERAAGLMNPFLMIIAIGLLIIDVSCYTALEIGRRYSQHHAAEKVEQANPPLGDMPVAGLRGS